MTGLEENGTVRVNGRHPWVIGYQFAAGGQTCGGSASTFNDPRACFQPVRPVYVLYQPDAPQQNALYPHP